MNPTLFTHVYVVAFVVIIGAIIALILATNKTARQLSEHIAHLAKEHGWAQNTPAPLPPFFADQHYESQNTLLEGTMQGRRFWLYECIPSPAYAKPTANSTLQPVTLLTVNFPQTFPDMLIMPAQGILATASDIAIRSSYGLTALELEGNFSQFIRVYMKPGQQIDVLSYIAPDVMATIQDHIESFVVFSGHSMSLLQQAPYQAKTVDDLLEDMGLLLKEIRVKRAKQPL